MDKHNECLFQDNTITCNQQIRSWFDPKIQILHQDITCWGNYLETDFSYQRIKHKNISNIKEKNKVIPFTLTPANAI